MIAPRIAGLDVRPVAVLGLGHGHEVRPEEHARDAAGREDAPRQRRGRAAASCREVGGAGGITAWPGRNFSVAGFGVDSVWMNMEILRVSGR